MSSIFGADTDNGKVTEKVPRWEKLIRMNGNVTLETRH